MLKRLFLVLVVVLSETEAISANFFEGFDGVGDPGAQWETAHWHNGSVFGCGFAFSEAWRTGWGAMQLNVNGSNPGDVRCAELRSWQSFQFGKFITRLQPGTIAGGNSAFFLYAGTAGMPDHFEIDVEIIHGGTTLHTNVWNRGQENYQQFSIPVGWRTIGFEWRPGFVRWFHVDDSGAEHEFRRVYTQIMAPMRLMLSHWVGNNSPGAIAFLGPYQQYGGGPAYFDWVRVLD